MREAVDEVVRYYETNAVFARQGGGERRLVSSAGIVAAAFDHRTSRAGDPLLHTHVVTANMTCVDGPTGARWRAIAGIGLYEHAQRCRPPVPGAPAPPARGSAGRAVRAGRERPRRGRRRAGGGDRRVLEAAERDRRGARRVREHARRAPRRSRRSTTRKAKDYGVDAETLEQRWRAEAADAASGPMTWPHASVERPPAPLEPAVVERCFELLAGPHGLTERSATFRRTDVIEAIASAAGASATAAQIEQLADRFLRATGSCSSTAPVPARTDIR